MSFLSRLLGSAELPAPAAIRSRLDEARGAQARNAERVAAAEAALGDVAIMNEAEHRLADDERAAAGRERVRLDLRSPNWKQRSPPPRRRRPMRRCRPGAPTSSGR